MFFFAQRIDRGYTLEPPCRGGSNEYPQSMFWSKNKKNRYTTTQQTPVFLYKNGVQGDDDNRAASRENRIFAYVITKVQISFTVTAKLISAFVFASR